MLHIVSHTYARRSFLWFEATVHQNLVGETKMKETPETSQEEKCSLANMQMH